MYQTMVSLEEILSKQYFFRIDNSYLVNVSHIEKINEKTLYWEQRTPISKHKREEFVNSLVYKQICLIT